MSIDRLFGHINLTRLKQDSACSGTPSNIQRSPVHMKSSKQAKKQPKATNESIAVTGFNLVKPVGAPAQQGVVGDASL